MNEIFCPILSDLVQNNFGFFLSKILNSYSKFWFLSFWIQIWGCIFSHVWPFYERAVSNLGPLRYMHRPVQVTHSLYKEGLHTTENTASEFRSLKFKIAATYQRPWNWFVDCKFPPAKKFFQSGPNVIKLFLHGFL